MPTRIKASPEREQAVGETREEQLLCPKCGETNPRKHNVCTQCGAHLHIRCHACGHRNERGEAHCAECGHRLHKSLLRRLEKKLFLKNRKLRIWQLPLLVAMVWVAYKLLTTISEIGLGL
jgi:uncharacterized membrane protein YvbJ